MKFDVVISNPPYQSPNPKARGTKLWPRFYGLSIDLLKDGGSLQYVTPATWLNRAPRGAWKHLREIDVTALRSDVSDYFPGVASTFAVVTAVKRPYGGSTLVDGEFSLDLHQDDFPANNTLLTRENVEFIRGMKQHQLTLDFQKGSGIVTGDERLSAVPTDEHTFETYYSSAKSRRSIWCSEPHGDHGVLKLIVGQYGDVMTTPEITTKAAGYKTHYLLGERAELEKVLELIRLPDNRRWVELMKTSAFIDPLIYVAEAQ